MLPSTYLSPESQGNPDTTSNQPSSPLSSLGSSPSSPTQREMEASRTDIASSEAMPPPAKPDAASKSANASSKRSHDKMNERAERASSRQDDAESDTTKGSTRGKNRANSTDTVNTVTNVSQDEGPSLRETDMNTEGLSQRPPQSAQAPGTPQPKQKAKPQPKKSKSKKTPKPVQDQPVTEDEAENDIDSSVDDEDASELPDQPIEGFDWEGLIYEYHKKTTALEQRESEIMGGCRQLMDFFEAWAVVGSRKETARSFKRLKTQMAYVEREEYDLDQKRLHYIQVVNAFKTVGVLLNKPDWHQSIVPTRRRISRLSTSLDQQASGITTHSRDPPAPVLQFWESAPSIADDIDMKKYHITDFHASRCVVL